MPFRGAETRRRLRTPALTYEGAAPECTIFIRFLPQSSGAISNTMRFLGNDWICYTVHVSNTTSLLLLECRMAERIHKHRLCTKRHLIYNAQVINYIFDNRCPTLIPHSRNYYAAQRDKCNWGWLPFCVCVYFFNSELYIDDNSFSFNLLRLS